MILSIDGFIFDFYDNCNNTIDISNQQENFKEMESLCNKTQVSISTNHSQFFAKLECLAIRTGSENIRETATIKINLVLR